MKSQKFPIIIEKDEDDIFIVSCPLFKGCHSYGKTIEEALVKIKEAIQLCLLDDNGLERNKYVRVQELNWLVYA